MIRSHVLICGGTGCTSSGSMKIISKFSEELAKQGLSDEIKVVQTGFLMDEEVIRHAKVVVAN